MKAVTMRTRILKHGFLAVALLIHLTSCGVINADDGIPIDGKIIFYSNRTEGKWGLHIYDGKKLRFLVEDWNYPQWLSNGNEILAAKAAKGEVAVFDASTGKIQRSYHLNMEVFKPNLLSDESGFIYMSKKPAFNSEGKRIGDIANLYLFELAAKVSISITEFEEVGHIAHSMSPINDWLAFNWSNMKPLSEFVSRAYLLNIKTNEKISLDDKIHSMAWTPDGKILYYVKAIKQGDPNRGIQPIVGLFSYDVESKESKLVHTPFEGSGFTFSPDGKKLLLANGFGPMFIFDLETKEYQEVLKPVKGRTINDGHADWIA